MKRFLFLILFSTALPLSAQVLITPLLSNPNLPQTQTVLEKQLPVSLILPFVDDFSDYEGFPRPLLWQDCQAYINKAYPLFPPSIGVATLDGLDATGKLYPHAAAQPFYADTLTSRPIRLDSVFGTPSRTLSPADSVYFSFYFQPGGGYGQLWQRIGNAPSKNDSLLLDFYDSAHETWRNVWATTGFVLDTLYAHDSVFFRYVHIPVTDTAFFTNDFRFRFRNISTLPNTVSPFFRNDGGQWHIDYVYLDLNRHFNDHSRKDIAFVSTAQSLLKTYQAMPVRQFRSDDLRDSLSLLLVNLHHEALSSRYKYEIFSSDHTLLHSYEGGVENIAPFQPQHNYQTAPNHARPPLDYAFSVSPDQPVSFEIRHLFQEGISQDIRPQNDTIVFTQHLSNYFAYDDGSSENGFGIVPVLNGRIAVGFSLRVPDTLTAVDLYFNSAPASDADNLFKLCIYTGDSHFPLHEVLCTEALSPQHESARNQYHRYRLPQAVVLPAGKFFVVLQQQTTQYMNLGYDRNHDASSEILFNTNGTWESVFTYGAVMLRPYFGAAAALSLSPVAAELETITCYPNPAKDLLHIQYSEGEPLSHSTVEVFSVYGQRVLTAKGNAPIDVSSLSNGVYILRIQTERLNGQPVTRKLIISK